jgi:NAD(P)-dependent dehydrogenase (short-subunit alcohol dehydrogenase family)
MSVLTGKRILVTGASSGIGRAVAVRSAAAGAAVAVAGRDAERTARTRLEIESAGGSAIAVLGDLSVETDAQAVVDAAAERLGGLDGVVNNAGTDVTDWAPVHEWETAAFDSLISANLRAPFLVAKYSLPHLLAAGGGSIVHISSVCAITVWAGGCAYRDLESGT